MDVAPRKSPCWVFFTKSHFFNVASLPCFLVYQRFEIVILRLQSQSHFHLGQPLLINLSNGYFFTHVMVVNLGEVHGRLPDGMLRAYHGGGHRWGTIGHRWDTMVWWTLHGVVDTSVRPGGQPHDFEIQPRQSLRM